MAGGRSVAGGGNEKAGGGAAGCGCEKAEGLAAQARGHFGHALAIGAGGGQIAGQYFFGADVNRSGGQRADGAAQRVQIGAGGCLGVGRRQAQADSDAAVLRGQGLQLQQGDLLVAVEAGAVGEAAEDFFAPAPGEPDFAGGIGKFLELPAGVAHVGGAAEDDDVGRGQAVPGDAGLGHYSPS